METGSSSVVDEWKDGDSVGGRLGCREQPANQANFVKDRGWGLKCPSGNAVLYIIIPREPAPGRLMATCQIAPTRHKPACEYHTAKANTIYAQHARQALAAKQKNDTYRKVKFANSQASDTIRSLHMRIWGSTTITASTSSRPRFPTHCTTLRPLLHDNSM